LANTLFDGLQLLAPLAIVTWLGWPQPARLLWVLACHIVALAAANAIGVLAALVAVSSGEVHLYAALTVLVVGGLSGLFITSMPGSLRAVEILLPFRHFGDSLLYAWGARPYTFLLGGSFQEGSCSAWPCSSPPACSIPRPISSRVSTPVPCLGTLEEFSVALANEEAYPATIMGVDPAVDCQSDRIPPAQTAAS
jgi:hypothetical protein